MHELYALYYNLYLYKFTASNLMVYGYGIYLSEYKFLSITNLVISL